MAYQNLGTPRFWVSTLQFLAYMGKASVGSGSTGNITTGIDEDILSLLYINPSEQLTITPTSDNYQSTDFIQYEFAEPLTNYMPQDQNFQMFLGHDLIGFTTNIRALGAGSDYTALANTELVNYGAPIERSGFSIAISNNAHDMGTNTLSIASFGNNEASYNVGQEYHLGSFLYGNYYDMPHSPDLNVTIGYEMDGVKKVKTKAGIDLVDHQYIRPLRWGDRAAWSIDNTDHELARVGRRFWDISFTMIENSDIFSEFSNVYHEEDYVYTNLLRGNTFYNQVIHKTCGGILPFVFQPDSNNNNPDQFSICKLDMDSLKLKQSANGVYNFSVRVKEVW